MTSSARHEGVRRLILSLYGVQPTWLDQGVKEVRGEAVAPAIPYLCQDVNAVSPGFWERETLRVGRRCRQSTDMQGGTDPRHTNFPQTAYDKGEQQAYRKYGIVVNDVNDIGRLEVCNPSWSTCKSNSSQTLQKGVVADGAVLIQPYNSSAKIPSSFCLVSTGRSRASVSPPDYGALADRLVHAVASRAFLLCIQLRRASSPFFADIKT